MFFTQELQQNTQEITAEYVLSMIQNATPEKPFDFSKLALHETQIWKLSYGLDKLQPDLSFWFTKFDCIIWDQTYGYSVLMHVLTQEPRNHNFCEELTNKYTSTLPLPSKFLFISERLHDHNGAWPFFTQRERYMYWVFTSAWHAGSSGELKKFATQLVNFLESFTEEQLCLLGDIVEDHRETLRELPYCSNSEHSISKEISSLAQKTLTVWQ